MKIELERERKMKNTTAVMYIDDKELDGYQIQGFEGMLLSVLNRITYDDLTLTCTFTFFFFERSEVGFEIGN